jgi:hypothetical protein
MLARCGCCTAFCIVGAERCGLPALGALGVLGAVGVLLLSGCPRNISMLGAVGHGACGCALSSWYISAFRGNHRTSCSACSHVVGASRHFALWVLNALVCLHWVLLVFVSCLGAQATFRCWVHLVIVLLGVHWRAGIFPLSGAITQHWLDVRVVVGAQCSGIVALALFGE